VREIQNFTGRIDEVRHRHQGVRLSSLMALPSGMTRKRKARTEQVVPGTDGTPHPSPLLGRRMSADTPALRGQPGWSTSDPGPDYPIPNFDVVYSRMRHPETGFDVADRRWRFLHYPKCFVGSESVEWMVRNLDMNRETAIKTGQHLMDAGIVHHVTHSEPFCDKYYFFRFQEDDESSVLNMKRVWDPSLPSRHAVEVSQDLLTRLACLCEEYRHRVINVPQTVQIQSPHPGAQSPRLLQTPGALAAGYRSELTNGSSAALRENELVAPTSTPASLSAGTQSGTPEVWGDSTPVSNTLAITGSNADAPSVSSFDIALPGTIASVSTDDVDYTMLAKSEEFRIYTLSAAELQRVQLLGMSHDERIAFFVNIYNALCLHCYVVKGAPTSVFRRWVFFRVLSYRIAGLDMSLDDIEHGILRGNKRAPMIKIIQQLRPSDPKCQHVLTNRDGRIHFVISAGTASDPPIRILDGENVQEQLHDATVEFLSHAVKIETGSRTVTLPRIFMWYADDFPGPERRLLEWVGQYLLAESASALASILGRDDNLPTITYENFDWCASDARFNAAVVRRKRRRLEREFAAAQAGLPLNSSPNIVQGPFDARLPQTFDVTGAFTAATAFPTGPEVENCESPSLGALCSEGRQAPTEEASLAPIGRNESAHQALSNSNPSSYHEELPS
jgi:hypothetical protein